MGLQSYSSKRSWWEFIDIGLLLQQLASVDEKSYVGSSAQDNEGVFGRLQRVREILSLDQGFDFYEVDRTVSRDLDRLIGVLEDIPATSKLNKNQCKDIIKFAKKTIAAMDREANRRFLFPAFPEQLLIIHDLLFGNFDTYFVLSDEWKYTIPDYVFADFSEAAVCFSICLPIPTITLILRGMEGLLRSFALGVLDELPVYPDGNEKVFPSISPLEQSGVNPQLIDLLKRIRNERNNAMHQGPRSGDYWTMNMAEKLFDDAKILMEMMALYLNDIGKSFRIDPQA